MFANFLNDFVFFAGCRKRNEKMQKELEDAAKDMRGLSPDSFRDCGPISFSPNAIPTKHYLHFVSSSL